MSQETLARTVGVVPSHLSQIETGERTPSVGLAKRLAQATGIPIGDLVSFEKQRASA